ncbi:MAG: DUF2281 domain-containing protein [Chloroherpetonaceae bacterium]|nr:DUF2281 domain-containing protein [Chloroherpetonaceae bacterium]
MTILDEIISKARGLSPERQREALDFIEFLAEKSANETREKIKMSFSWEGNLQDEKKTALEAQKEILRRRGES